MKSAEKGLAICFLSMLFFQAPLFAGDAANEQIGGDIQAQIPSRSPVSQGIDPVKALHPTLPRLEDSLAIESPISRVGSEALINQKVLQPPMSPLRPTPIPVTPKPLVRREETRPASAVAAAQLTKPEVFQALVKAKKKKKEKIERLQTPEIQITRTPKHQINIEKVQVLELTPESAAIRVDLSGLDPAKMQEMNALLRSSADSTDIFRRQIIGMNCKGNSCTALAQGLLPETSYIISVLVPAFKDLNQETFFELVSKNIEQRTFLTPQLPAGEISEKVKQIFLKEIPADQQGRIDGNSIEISDLQSESCTAVAVCPKRSYNVAAKSRSGSERVVGTVALFDGKGDRYVSDFRIQKKALSAPMPRIV